jgi:hypothetical protein
MLGQAALGHETFPALMKHLTKERYISHGFMVASGTPSPPNN